MLIKLPGVEIQIDLTTAPAEGTKGAPIDYSKVFLPEPARPPRIGQHWPFAGGIYAGIMRATEEGARDYHLILVEEEPVGGKGDWNISMTWGEEVGQGLPTLRELSLLRANLPEHFKPEAYWSCEVHESNSGWAWCQHFHLGTQGDLQQRVELRARAVRRLSI